jgi:hypothetical protein
MNRAVTLPAAASPLQVTFHIGTPYRPGDPRSRSQRSDGYRRLRIKSSITAAFARRYVLNKSVALNGSIANLAVLQ